jgi:hypothetical protein
MVTGAVTVAPFLGDTIFTVTFPFACAGAETHTTAAAPNPL